MACTHQRSPRATQRLLPRYIRHHSSPELELLLSVVSCTKHRALLQALEIMEKLILPGSEKMDVRDPDTVSKR